MCVLMNRSMFAASRWAGSWPTNLRPMSILSCLFPDSGVYSAVGFAQCAELPYEHAMIRNHYVGRTFIQPTQSMRNFSVRVKINPVRPMIDGKKNLHCRRFHCPRHHNDDQGQKLRELGAKEVHIRISSPPVKFPCHYGVDFSVRGELIAAN